MYEEKHLITDSLKFQQQVNDYCYGRGFTPAWQEVSKGVFRMTKHPLAMLYWLLSQLENEQDRKQFNGAWRINMSSSCIALNFIVDTFVQQDVLHMKKFTMFYPNVVTSQQPIVALDCPSFRTSILKGNIEEARQILQTLQHMVPSDVIIDLYEDTIYPRPQLSTLEKARVMKQFVKFMKDTHSEWLHASYNGEYTTALEEEFELMKTCGVGGFTERTHLSEDDQKRKFALSVIVEYKKIEYYPPHCTEAIQKEWKNVLVAHPHATLVTSMEDVPLSVIHTAHTIDGGTPLHYHNAYVKFIPIENNHKWCAIQCTRRGGFRLVFLIDIHPDSTTHRSPVDKTALPLPSMLLDQDTAHAHWCWCANTSVPFNKTDLFDTFRKIDSSAWNPYTQKLSSVIENAYQQNKASCNGTIGCVELEFQFGSGSLQSRETGLQCNRGREHFIKRIILTNTDYQKLNETYKVKLQEMQTRARGEKENCVICMDSLENSKCMLTPCGHLFHTLCLHEYVHATHKQDCPSCRSSLQQTSSLPFASKVYHGR